jgi:calcineurin-like phosphoesterase family protein
LKDHLIIPDNQLNNFWFTSDTHFGSGRTLTLSRRPYPSTLEMDEIMIIKWNKKVKDNDIVFHLGDFGDWSVLERLNGHIFLVPGNWDDDIPKGHTKLKIIPNNFKIYVKNKILELVHIPSDFSGEADLCLFGHIHKQTFKKNGLNVGVDSHHFYPLNFDDIFFYFDAIIKYYDSEVFREFC